MTAAALGLEAQQDPPGAPALQAREIERLPMRAQRVGADEGGDQLVVAGMQLEQRGRRPTPRLHAIVLERDLAGVADENVAGRDIAPAARLRTQAEIVLLAI